MAYTDVQRTSRARGSVEAARSETFAAVTPPTALRHAMEHAAGRAHAMAEQIGKLEVESQGCARGRAGGARARRRRGSNGAGCRAMASLRLERAAKESELAGARRIATARHRSSVLTSTSSRAAARLQSLEELEAARASTATVPAFSWPNLRARSRAGMSRTISRLTAAMSALSRPVRRLLQHVVVQTHDRRKRGCNSRAAACRARRVPGRDTCADTRRFGAGRL